MYPESAPRAAAVVCHAHPLHGGIMHFKVIYRAAKALQEQGVAALRFNFRGVGRSEGAHDDGRGEQEDAGAALDDLARRFPGVPLLLGGFSFGAQVALRVAVADPRVAAAFALGYPLSMASDVSFLDGYTRPRLFVHGENDAIGAVDRIRAWVDRLPEPKRLIVVPGVDHFFAGNLDAVQQAVASWTADVTARGAA